MDSVNDPWFENKTKEEVIKEIGELRRNIKKKHRALKQNIVEQETFIEQQLKPLADPLNKLVEETKIANEEFVQDIDVKRRKRKVEEEETGQVIPVKRFIENPPQGVKRKKKINVRHNLNYDSQSESDDGQNVHSQVSKRFAPTVEPENVEMSEFNPEVAAEMEIQQALPNDDEIYETRSTGEQLLQTPEGKSLAKNYIDSNFKGKLAREYFSKLIGGTKTIDHNYGVRVDGNEWKIGNEQLELDFDDFIINGKRYKGTRGLYELIFMNNPNEYIYTEEDLQDYGKVLLDTNVHRVNYSAIGKLRSNRGRKYKNIIAPLIAETNRANYMETYSDHVTASGPSGSGILLTNDKPNVIYYDNPNEIVDRLRVLLGSQEAGHTGHENEINAIVEELKELQPELSKQLL